MIATAGTGTPGTPIDMAGEVPRLDTPKGVRMFAAGDGFVLFNLAVNGECRGANMQNVES